MQSLKSLQEEYYRSCEELPKDKNNKKGDASKSEIVMALSFLIFLIYGIYKGSIYVLNSFPKSSWFVIALLFIVMLVVVFIGSLLLSAIIEKIVSRFTLSESERIKKQIISICTREIIKEGLFTLDQLREKTILKELDEELLQAFLEGQVESGNLEEIQLNENSILYKCLLESAKKNIKVEYHAAP